MPDQARPASTGIAGAMDYVPVGQAEPERCFICGGPWRKGGASYAARAGARFPGLGRPVVEVCSAACAADPRWARRSD